MKKELLLNQKNQNNEEVNYEILPPSRGDSFDVGGPVRTHSGWNYPARRNTPENMLVQILSNPRALVGNVDQEQIKNIKGAIVALGTFGIHRFLSGLFGDVLGGAIGGGLSGYAAGKAFPKHLVNRLENIFMKREEPYYGSRTGQQAQYPPYSGDEGQRGDSEYNE